jgi:hypothetical protein
VAPDVHRAARPGSLTSCTGCGAEIIDPDASDDTGAVTLVVSTPLFGDGFESGDLSAWSSSVP